MRYVLFTLSALFLLSACSKTEPLETREDTLRASRWRIFSSNVRSIIPTAAIDTVSTEDTLRGCRADNYLEFKENFTGLHFTGKDKCSPSEEDQSEFFWEMKNAGTNLNIYNAGSLFGTDAVNGELVEFSDSKMKLRYSQIFQNPSQPKVVDTFIITTTMIKI